MQHLTSELSVLDVCEVAFPEDNLGLVGGRQLLRGI